MAYLEELLPEFRKVAKIRRKNWSEGRCIKLDINKKFIIDNNNKLYTIYAEELIADNWEFCQEPEPDWDYIIKNKCLCWFWCKGGEEKKVAGLLADYDSYNSQFGRYKGKNVAVTYFDHCRPVRRDEVSFYEEEEEEEQKETEESDALNLLASTLKDGWIAQDESGFWFLYTDKPEIHSDIKGWNNNDSWYSLRHFNLPKADDWKDSLYQIKERKLIKC